MNLSLSPCVLSSANSCRRSRQRRSSPLKTLDVTMPQAGYCTAVGLEYGCIGMGTLIRSGLRVPWMPCLHAIPTSCNWAADWCMMVVLAPVVEAARLPRVCPMALGYGLPPSCNSTYTSRSIPILTPTCQTSQILL